MDNSKKNVTPHKKASYDYCTDFKTLPSEVKRTLIKTAKNLLKQQEKDNSMAAVISVTSSHHNE